jgi:CRP-like cAMP-binding protein
MWPMSEAQPGIAVLPRACGTGFAVHHKRVCCVSCELGSLRRRIGFANAFCDSQRAQQGRCAFTYGGTSWRTGKGVSFDPKQFLAKIGEGKSVSQYHKNQIICSQGEIAEAIFYIREGKVKLTVVSEQGKEAVVAILRVCHFLANDQQF